MEGGKGWNRGTGGREQLIGRNECREVESVLQYC